MPVALPSIMAAELVGRNIISDEQSLAIATYYTMVLHSMYLVLIWVQSFVILQSPDLLPYNLCWLTGKVS